MKTDAELLEEWTSTGLALWGSISQLQLSKHFQDQLEELLAPDTGKSREERTILWSILRIQYETTLIIGLRRLQDGTSGNYRSVTRLLQEIQRRPEVLTRGHYVAARSAGSNLPPEILEGIWEHNSLPPDADGIARIAAEDEARLGGAMKPFIAVAHNIVAHSGTKRFESAYTLDDLDRALALFREVNLRWLRACGVDIQEMGEPHPRLADDRGWKALVGALAAAEKAAEVTLTNDTSVTEALTSPPPPPDAP